MKEARLGIIDNCRTAIQSAYDTLQDVRDEEEMAYDGLPEGIQMSERGDMMQEAIDTLDEANGYLEDAISYLDGVFINAESPYAMESEPWKNLKVGDSVTHKSFGSGVIKLIEGNRVTIDFRTRCSLFILPDAIDKGFIIL